MEWFPLFPPLVVVFSESELLDSDPDEDEDDDDEDEEFELDESDDVGVSFFFGAIWSIMKYAVQAFSVWIRCKYDYIVKMYVRINCLQQ